MHVKFYKHIETIAERRGALWFQRTREPRQLPLFGQLQAYLVLFVAVELLFSRGAFPCRSAERVGAQ